MQRLQKNFQHEEYRAFIGVDAHDIGVLFLVAQSRNPALRMTSTLPKASAISVQPYNAAAAASSSNLTIDELRTTGREIGDGDKAVVVEASALLAGRPHVRVLSVLVFIHMLVSLLQLRSLDRAVLTMH